MRGAAEAAPRPPVQSTMFRNLLLVAFSATFVLTGCTSGDEETLTEPPKVAFSGTPDPEVAGVWKNEKGTSTYRLDKSGTYLLESKVPTPGGSMDTKSEGQWSTDAGKFLMKDKAGNVVAYTMTLKGSTMTLTTTGSLKNVTVLTKQ